MHNLSNGKEVTKYLNGLNSRALEFEDGVRYLDYSEEENKLFIGTMTNAGFIRQYEWEYDFDHTFDDNLLGFVEMLENEMGIFLAW